MPPFELASMAAIFRNWHNGEAIIVDAIADNLNEQMVSKIITCEKPDLVVTIAGLEFIENDLKIIDNLKREFPNISIVLFGHYAGEFHKEILLNSSVDFIIHGEPELIFSDLISALGGRKQLDEVKGISYRTPEKNVHQLDNRRIPNPNELPFPAYDLLDLKKYSEPFFPSPYVTIQSARGCPYSCNYCVKTYGTKLTALTPENMLYQIKKLIAENQIKSYRFIDDTFTATPARVISFCKLIVENKLNHIKWSCFSRPDTLSNEMLLHMKQAGCTRIYFGIESGSQKILDFYQKGLNIEKAKENIINCKNFGIETIGLFMVGAPGETQEDMEKSIAMAKECKVDFISISQFSVYPGTPLFKKMENEISFKLFPYENNFKDQTIPAKANRFQHLFFKQFYLRVGFLKSLVSVLINAGVTEVTKTAFSFLNYLLFSQKDTRRKDYI